MAEDKKINVEIVTPERSIFSGTAIAVTLPGSLAPFQVLYNHAPIVSALDEGIIKVKISDGKDIFFASSTGFVEVSSNKVSALVESAFNAQEIDEKKERENLSSLYASLKLVEDEAEKNELQKKALLSGLKIKAVELSKK